jgi:hypothetical protein
MNIIICGDSWSNGAYDLKDCPHPTHPGIEYFLEFLDNHRVVNLSVRGGSNLLAIKILEKFLQESNICIDAILFMQCSFMRDYKSYTISKKYDNPDLSQADLDWDEDYIEKILKPHFKKIYNQIKSICQEIPVILIGGNTKVHPFLSKQLLGNAKSGIENIDSTACDSYFDNRIEFECFIKEYFKRTNVNTEKKYKIVDNEMKLFKNKMDILDSNNKYFNAEHGTTEWHFMTYQQIKPIIERTTIHV